MHRLLLRTFVLGLLTFAAAGNVMAEKCWIDAQAEYKVAGYYHQVYLTPMRVEVALAPAHYKHLPYEFDLARSELPRLKAAAESFVKSKLAEVHARFPELKGERGNAHANWIGGCNPSAAAVEARRKERDKPEFRTMKLDGDWTKSLVASNGQDITDKPRQVGERPTLTRVDPSYKPSAEEIANTRKVAEADRKRKADEAAKVKAQKTADRAKALERESVHRASCMKPENRGSCGCGIFFPETKGSACGK